MNHDDWTELELFSEGERPSGTYAKDSELETQSPRPRSMKNVVGESAPLQELYELVDRIADTDCTVLVTGESGTGKELVARALHDASSRASGRLVAVNCGAIPETLLESELFGHARGAFTGAHAAKQGRVAHAEGGTLFLDEIGELPLAVQVKLLRLLQSQEYSPIGDNRTYRANVRIVAATNVDLDAAVDNGTFREDLYYRLNVIHLQVPALRDRTSDIPLLVQHFIAAAGRKTGRDVARVSRATAELLMTHRWPGNVRELENTMERAVLLCRTDCIEPGDLPARVRGFAGGERRATLRLPDSGMDLKAAVESFENELIRQALERTKWNKNQAARLLGLNRTTLVEMIKRKRLESNAA